VPDTSPELRWGRNLNNRASGDLGKEMARCYLAGKGYEIVESNYRTRRGELDLISRQDETLVIVEVKLRRGTAYGTTLEAVTSRKQNAFRLIAEEYLSEKSPEFQSLRFDMVGILIRGGRTEITHIQGAF
jgi:putative endonuclease